eukprot:365825-Chlamydomonas_euryale.AAC.6
MIQGLARMIRVLARMVHCLARSALLRTYWSRWPARERARPASPRTCSAIGERSQSGTRLGHAAPCVGKPHMNDIFLLVQPCNFGGWSRTDRSSGSDLATLGGGPGQTGPQAATLQLWGVVQDRVLGLRVGAPKSDGQHVWGGWTSSPKGFAAILESSEKGSPSHTHIRPHLHASQIGSARQPEACGLFVQEAEAQHILLDLRRPTPRVLHAHHCRRRDASVRKRAAEGATLAVAASDACVGQLAAAAAGLPAAAVPAAAEMAASHAGASAN